MEMNRKNLYTDEARAQQHTYIAEDLPKGSVYQSCMSTLTLPEDYGKQSNFKPMEAQSGSGHTGTAHWKSTSHALHGHDALTGAAYQKQFGPGFKTSTNPPTCVGRPEEQSQYQEDFGRYGSDPRHKLKPTDEKMPFQKTVLANGTTKGTDHMPGYSGHLASNDRNPGVAEYIKGKHLRNSTDKTNLTQMFHTNIVGYSGHIPYDSRNDNGGHTGGGYLTTSGRDFQQPSKFC
jgi:hypothetical protein